MTQIQSRKRPQHTTTLVRPRRSSTTSTTAATSIWILMIASRGCAATMTTMAYTLPPGMTRPLCKTCSSHGGSQSNQRLWRDPLRMALDSRELRFYASSSRSSSNVARASGAATKGGGSSTSSSSSSSGSVTKTKTKTIASSRMVSGDANTGATVAHTRATTTSTTTYYSSSSSSRRLSEAAAAAASQKNSESANNNNNSISNTRTNHELLDSLASPAISIYANGILGLMNSFDSEVKRAFSHPGSSASSSSAAAAGYAAHYSTSSAMFTSTSLLPDDHPFSGSNNNNNNNNNGQRLPELQLQLQQQLQQQSQQQSQQPRSPTQQRKNVPDVDLTTEEKELFDLLRTVTSECGMQSTLRVAGGWVRDKILASKEFKQNHRMGMELHGDGTVCSSSSVMVGGAVGVGGVGVGGKTEMEGGGEMNRITSKFKGEKAAPNSSSSATTSQKTLSVTTPVDIDIALDDKLGREFADELNQWLSDHGRETHSVGVVLKNPEKSKHLETATMRVNNYWIDFVNLRAEEYTSDSRIPDLMRIGTAEEDAFRRDLTINSLFYNINEGVVEDMTGRGLEDLRRGIVATPLPPLTTLLDDPLRVLRSVRFAARLRFGMAESLREAAADSRVKAALAQKVSRERVGSEVDLMLKSRDPVGAMRLLINLGLIDTVFPLPEGSYAGVYDEGHTLLATAHDHLCDCKENPPLWCEAKRALEAGAVNGVGKDETRVLMEDEDARRLLWYAAFLKPLRDSTISNDNDNDDFEPESKKKPRKSNRSIILKLLVDELKRPTREGDAVDKIMRAADGFTKLVSIGSDVSAYSVLLSGAHVVHRSNIPEGESGSNIVCTMDGRVVDPDTEDDPVWKHCMEFRLGCAEVLRRIGPLWRAAFILSLCEQLTKGKNSEMEYMIEGDVAYEAEEEVISGILANYDAFAAAIMQLGLIGIWNQQPLVNGDEIKKTILPNIKMGPVFRDVMATQTEWMTCHPGGTKENLVDHLRREFPDYA